jgi:hypothetical protein
MNEAIPCLRRRLLGREPLLYSLLPQPTGRLVPDRRKRPDVLQVVAHGPGCCSPMGRFSHGEPCGGVAAARACDRGARPLRSNTLSNVMAPMSPPAGHRHRSRQR